MSDRINDIENISNETIDDELYQGMYDSVIQLIALEGMHGDLDLDDESVRRSLSKALLDLSRDILKKTPESEA
tara:strand:- start:528 stop:746 length:219 start_codon:yes stop_codon:yes gene_type:complete